MIEEIINFLKPFKKYLILNLVIVLIILLAVFLYSFRQTPEFKAESTILIIPQGELAAVPKTASQTSEVYVNLIAEIIYSDAFLNDLRAELPELDKKLSDEAENIDKAWRNKVNFYLTDVTGIAQINTYDQDKTFALNLNQAVISSLSENMGQYAYDPGQFIVKTINYPKVSDSPVRPRIFVNLFIALVAGLIFTISLSHFLNRLKI